MGIGHQPGRWLPTSQQTPLSTGEGPPLPPWSTSQSLLPPLMQECEQTMQQQQQQLDSYKVEMRELKTQLGRLISENQRLTKELKESVQSQLNMVENRLPSNEQEQLISQLRQQLLQAKQDKESSVVMWQSALQEVHRLDTELQQARDNPDLRQLQAHTAQVEAQYMNRAHVAQAEVEGLTQQLKQSRVELEGSGIQVRDLRRTLEALRDEVVWKEREASGATQRERACEADARELQAHAHELETQLTDSQDELDRMRAGRGESDKTAANLQARLTELEKREHDSIRQVRDSVQLVETAVLERDQALVREKQQQAEVDRLKEALTQLVEEAGVRTKQEVDAIRKQCNENIGRLMEEIQALELDNSEKQAQLDRAVRERRSVEAELEKVYQEGSGQASLASVDELYNRISLAQKAKDEAYMKLESLKNRFSKLESSYQQEKRQGGLVLGQARERVDTLTTQLQLVSEERLKLAAGQTSLQRRVQDAVKDAQAAARKMTTSVAAAEEKYEMKVSETDARVQAMEESHRGALAELRSMLTAQQRMSVRWKEEVQLVSTKFERALLEKRAELKRSEQRCQELMDLLQEARQKGVESERLMSEYAVNIQRSEQRVREADAKTVTASVKLSQALNRQRHLEDEIHEQTQQQRELQFRSVGSLRMGDISANH
ncbi:PREDICTED: sodium channel and clathrin linker 1-like [Priapulus caudatus]|uniref:Sodium channel and clathrin linker 1-like n=1 Tax=Priapulus caudatus TaxID=37621 RepID=A0ABM1E4G1_PRICU|nr:PREDICTED: sodium channel and clathrin linker 1-like [Priapulus caudatus]